MDRRRAIRSSTSWPRHRVFRPAAERAYRVERVGEGSYRVSGRGIERLLARYDLDNEDALAHLERRLRGIGVIGALEAQGFEPGDDVEIAGVRFELDPDRVGSRSRTPDRREREEQNASSRYWRLRGL